jgi:hypothetical protein
MSKDSLCCGVRSTSNASLLITSLIDTGVERTPQHNESFDITGPEIMNYKELIQRTAVVLNKSL